MRALAHVCVRVNVNWTKLTGLKASNKQLNASNKKENERTRFDIRKVKRKRGIKRKKERKKESLTQARETP